MEPTQPMERKHSACLPDRRRSAPLSPKCGSCRPLRSGVLAALLALSIAGAPLAALAQETGPTPASDPASVAAANPSVPAAPSSGDPSSEDDLSVVAYINGEPLPTSLLTDYIDAVRATVGSQTNAAWEAYLADQGYTVDEYRAMLIAHYAREMVLTQRADELGLEVDVEEVEAHIAQMKADLGVDTDETAFLWDAYLGTYGFTEESLRANQAYYLLRAKLYEQEVERPEVDDALVQRYANAYGYLYGVPQAEDGTADLSQVDDATLARVEAGAEAFAWDCACDLYASGLLAQADIQILIAHQYDVPGQDHDAS